METAIKKMMIAVGVAAMAAAMEVPSRKTYADIPEGCTALLKSL